MRQVEFFIDNIQIATISNSPYSTTYDGKNLSAGNHQITVKVIDNRDLSASNSINIKIFKDVNPPSPVSNVITTPLSKSALISWNNPSDNDLNEVRIYISTINGSLGVLNTKLAVSPNTSSSTTISNLISGTLYYFTIRTVDNSENENQSTTQYNVQPL